MITIQIPLVCKEGTKLIKYPEDSNLFKNGTVVNGQVACDYYGELDTYAEYVWPIEYKDATMSRYEFMKLVGVTTMVAIKTAAKSSVEVEVFVLMIESAEEINLSEPSLISGLSDLVLGGVIIQEESERILQG